MAMSGDLVVDARSQASACAGVALQQMALSRGGNLTLLVGKFDTINGLPVISRDGVAHTVTIKIEGASESTKSISASPRAQRSIRRSR